MLKVGIGGPWIQFAYEKLVEFCYGCGIIGHGKSNCSTSNAHGNRIEGTQYGPWLKAEPDVYTERKDNTLLQWVPIPRGGPFVSSSEDVNTDP